jgi:DNA-binding response OmpR family regulator
MSELAGVVCSEAGEAKQVLAHLRSEAWDLVILDVTMPGQSGLDPLSDLKQLRPGSARSSVEHAPG